MTDGQGVDLSGLHREIDRVKSELCRCRHEGTCVSCKGFEVVRQQAQAVAAAASQPVLMQVAQEAAIKDLMTQLGGLQDKLAADPQLSELMARFAERVQEDLGGPEKLQELMAQLGFMGQAGQNPFEAGKGDPSSGGSPFDAFAEPDENPPPDTPQTGGGNPGKSPESPA